METPTRIPSSPHTERLLFLDVLRVLSLLFIICYHFDAEVNRIHPGAHIVATMTLLYQAVGDVGVTLFIMLSGASLATASRANERFSRFICKRALAIYPPYWTAYLALTTILFFARGSLQGNEEPWKIPLSILGIDGFLGTLTYSYYYLTGEWFLGFILIMYLFFPVLSKATRRSPAVALVAAFAFSAAAAHLCRHVSWLAALHNPLVRIPDFLFGMIYTSYRLDKKWWIGIAGAVAIPLSPHLPSWGIAELPALVLGAGIVAATGSLCNFVRVAPTVQAMITKLAALSFLAFLMHHWLIYLFLPRFNLAILGKEEVYFLFATIVGSSFLAAKYLEPLSASIRRGLAILLRAHGIP